MRSFLFVLILSGALLAPRSSHALNQDEMHTLLKAIDDRQGNNGDYAATVYIERQEKDKNKVIYEAMVYRRDEEDKLMILFTKPRAEAGKGYLRLDKNMFIYDPSVGKWERRTDRERIGGTDSRRQDFDDSKFAELYTATYVAEEKLGQFPVHRLKLDLKPGADAAFPVTQMWIDKATGNLLKIQEFALSGKLMRTSYYPKWEKKFSASKKSEVYYPKEIRMFDEVVKGDNTVVVLMNVDLNPLPANMFTKAWLESKSR